MYRYNYLNSILTSKRVFVSSSYSITNKEKKFVSCHETNDMFTGSLYRNVFISKLLVVIQKEISYK